MYWIALLPLDEKERTAWGWRALQFTPRVAWVDEALLLEVSASQRLWGGAGRLLRLLLKHCEPLAPAAWAAGPSALIALALLSAAVLVPTISTLVPRFRRAVAVAKATAE